MGKAIVSRRVLIASIAGTACCFVLMRYVSIPSGIPSTNLNMAAVVVVIVSAIFGPVAGFFVGFTGHALADLASGYGIWWTWAAADGIYGLLVGLFSRFFKIEEGLFGVREALVFNAVQILANVVCWLLLAPTLDIIFYQEAANKVYLQGLVAAILNSVVILVLGTIMILCYSRIISAGYNDDGD
ncbi:MAG: ECF-type riboflavin transporter substrate-binding protein [Treponema sp.]|nr:ECF-type riboflavin transporter substrate-binding protein [Treponema sp.]